MISFLKKILKKYEELSVEMKATVWYTIGNIIQKIAPWLVMIILTHYLTTEDYGIYSIFLSWLEIFEIIITLRLYSNGYVAGLIRDEKNRAIYTATIQSLSIIMIIFWLLIYLIFHKVINDVTEINMSLNIIMICSFIGTVSFGLWSSRQRIDNKYKIMIVAIIMYGLVGPVLGALTVFFNFDNAIFYVIVTRTIIQLVVAIPFFVSNYKGSSKIFQKEIAIEVLKYNLPLIPYYLSMILLNHSDRLMIQKFDGYNAAALYSISYSAAMIIFVISGALNLSLQAWLFKELKKGNSNEDKTRLITSGTLIVALCTIAEIIIAPELILILGGSKYLEAIWVIPPLAINNIIMFIYQQYVNILFYYKRTKIILFASVFAAICNIMLNAIFIPIFGYVAGGYTSLVSYLIVMIFYLILAKKECDTNEISMSNYFDTKLQMIILCGSCVIAILMIIVYRNTIIRYTMFLVFLLFIIINRKKWLPMLKEGRKL